MSSDVSVTVLISHTTVILLVLKAKKASTVDTNAKSRKLNARINAHVTSNVRTDVHVHHGAFQKNKSVRPSGNMKMTNAAKTVIILEAKCLICARVDAPVIPLALIRA